jgi:hypothetical protein
MLRQTSGTLRRTEGTTPAASAFVAHRSPLKNVSRQALVQHEATICLRYGEITPSVQLLDPAPKLGRGSGPVMFGTKSIAA